MCLVYLLSPVNKWASRSSPIKPHTQQWDPLTFNEKILLVRNLHIFTTIYRLLFKNPGAQSPFSVHFLYFFPEISSLSCCFTQIVFIQCFSETKPFLLVYSPRTHPHTLSTPSIPFNIHPISLPSENLTARKFCFLPDINAIYYKLNCKQLEGRNRLIHLCFPSKHIAAAGYYTFVE